jgi:tetratricopeptide (TPR) repeat protein
MSDPTRPTALFPPQAGRTLRLALLLAGSMAAAACGSLPVQAQASATAAAAPPAAEEPAPPVNSPLDAPLFYQLLLGEMALREGEAGSAYQVILDAARRSGQGPVFRRAVEIALQARAGEQALQAVQAWRTAHPRSVAPVQFQVQILDAMGRSAELGEPLRALVTLTPAAERGGLIAALPRFLQRADAPQRLKLLEEVLAPHLTPRETRVPARLALARGAAAAGQWDRAMTLAREAQRMDPNAPGPALLGIEWLPQRPDAEALVRNYLARPQAENAVRLAWVRVLTGNQRYADALAQLQIAVRQQPDVAGPYLTLGALHLEVRQREQGEAALMRFLELAHPDTTHAPPARGQDAPTDEDHALLRPEQGIVQARLMLAQSAEARGDFAAAEAHLAHIDDPQRLIDVQARRASLLARQGRLDEGLALLRDTPERRPEDARAKLVAEAGVQREMRHWAEAHAALAQANARFPDDPDLLYEQAMMAEKIDSLDEMEQLLRRVMVLAPDNAHAYNALGYTLADRGKRLDEARELIQRALQLAPGDPFITDSLGWVEFRLGNHAEALRLLQQAYIARPDTEIGVHLGEVLWVLGRRQEALGTWREVAAREPDSDLLRETLARLGASL